MQHLGCQQIQHLLRWYTDPFSTAFLAAMSSDAAQTLEINDASLGIIAIVVAPTRERAEKIHQEAMELVPTPAIKPFLLMGGGPSLRRQGSAQLSRAQILVGTKGKLLTHLRPKQSRFATPSYNAASGSLDSLAGLQMVAFEMFHVLTREYQGQDDLLALWEVIKQRTSVPLFVSSAKLTAESRERLWTKYAKEGEGFVEIEDD